MRRQLSIWAMAVAGFIASSFVMFAQPSGVKASDALIDVLVWGADQQIDPSAYSPAIKAELEKHLRRFKAYRSKRARTVTFGELAMVYDAQVSYERTLAAVSVDPQAPALAAAYVDSLRPCYEWEGFHDCPEREATFATEYQAAHPGGPFSEYLTLLAAHRWLCAAESYEYEKQPDGAARSRRAYEQTISTAQRSPALLVRSAAEGLVARGRCFSQR